MSDQNNSPQQFHDHVTQVLKGLKVKKIRTSMDDDEILKVVKPLFNWTPSTLVENNDFKKSSIESMKYAELAVEAVNNYEESRSVKLANLITAFAQDDGDLALGHLIRVQIFDMLGLNVDQKIKELELCLQSPQPPKKVKESIKLGFYSKEINLNKEQLTQILSDFKTTPKQFSHFNKCYDELEKLKDKKKQFTRDLFTLKSPNPKAPAIEDFVEIKYNSVKGRHLVVTKDVPAGTPLILEKPLVSGLATVLDLEINRCHYCYKQNFVPIPCPNCVFVLYCSEKCFEESKEYHHNYECSAFPALHNVLQTSCGFLLAYAAVCKLGPQQLFSTFQKEQELLKAQNSESKKQSEIPGVDPVSGIYDSASAFTMNHMAKVKDSCEIQDGMNALALTEILEARTSFFQKLELELKDLTIKAQFKDFITQFLFDVRRTHSQMTLIEQKYADNPFAGSQIYAYALVPTLNLTNHSCDNNIADFDTSNLNQLGAVAVALRDIKAGEEICRNYCPSFSKASKAVRAKELLKRFDFICDCVACVNDWPLMEKLEAEKDSPKFCCPRCSSKIPPEPKMMTKENFEKIALNSGNNFICPGCKADYGETKLLSFFKTCKTILEDSEKLINSRKSVETLRSLKAASTFFQKYLIPPTIYHVKCQNLIDRAIVNSVVPVYD